MILQQADRYIKACMQAWLFCESCIHNEISAESPRTSLVERCHQCAQTCFAMVCQLISNQVNIPQLAMNCIIECRQCEAECEKYWYEDDINFCGDVCHECAERMKDIAIPGYYLN